jgi:VanZ family protein
MKRLPLIVLCLAFVYEIAVLYASVQPVRRYTVYFDGQDKVIHFVIYFIMGGLLAAAAATGGRGYFYAGGVLSGLFIGIVTEFLQRYVPTRTQDFFDGLYNVLGLLTVIAVYEAVHLWHKGGIIYRETLPPPSKESARNENKGSGGS